MVEFRKWVLLVVALVVTAAWVGPARPADKDKTTDKKQRRKEKLIAEEGAIRVVLLRHKSVRHDLKLTDKQAEKAREFAKRQWKKAQSVSAMPDKEKREAQWKEMAQENDKFLKDTLTAAQFKRLDQIGMQVAGLLWVTRGDVALVLKLTPEQKKKAHELQKTAHKEFHDVVHSEKGGDHEAKFAELRKTNRKRLHDLLTEKQRATWKELRGEPFKGDLSKD